MTRSTPWFSLAALLGSVIVATIPMPTRAFYIEERGPTESNVVRYDTCAPVEFRVGLAGIPGGDDFHAAIAAAFQTWEDVACSGVSFVQGPRVELPDPYHWQSRPNERYILIYWSADAGQFSNPRVGDFFFSYDEAGGLIGGTIVLNSKDHTWATDGAASSLDVQGTVTAMIGRVLGITSQMEGNATYPTYSPGDTSKRTLGSDDIAAINCLYGNPDDCTQEAPEGICTDAEGEVCPPTSGGDVDAGAGDPDGGSAVDAGAPTDAGEMADAGATDMDAGPPPVLACPEPLMPDPSMCMVTPPPDASVIPAPDGAVIPGADGSIAMVDAGAVDAGTSGGGDDGCGCVAAGAKRDGAAPIGVIALLGLAWVGAKRRRRR